MAWRDVERRTGVPTDSSGAEDSTAPLLAGACSHDCGDVCFDGPSGKVCLDPKSQHMSHTIYLARVTEDHKIEFPSPISGKALR